MSNYNRKSFMPFSLHNKPYDPPEPNITPLPPSSAPVVMPPPPPDTGVADSASASLRPDSHTGSGRPARDPRRSVAEVQSEIDSTVAIMRGNLQSLAGRGERLETLEARTEDLIESARVFRKSSSKVRKAMWWKDVKMRFIIGLAVSGVIALTVFSIVQAVRRSKAKSHLQVNAKAEHPPQVTQEAITPPPS